MDTEILLKSLAILIAAIGTGIAVFKTVLDFTLVKKSKGRDEYKFAKEFFADLAGPEPLHPYLKEKGFQALTGGNDLEVDEIEYLLTLEKSATALRKYSFGKKYLKYSPNGGYLKIDFLPNYKNKNYRLLLKSAYLVGYVSLSMLTGAPIIFSRYLSGLGISPFGVFIITLLICAPYAYKSLRAGVRITRAEELVASQKSHTHKVYFQSLSNKKEELRN